MKECFRDFLPGKRRVDLLKIDSDRTAADESPKCEFRGYGETELDSVTLPETRLTVGIVGELKACGGLVKVRGQNSPKNSPADDKPSPISIETKSRRAGLFIGGKGFSNNFQRLFETIQIDKPQVNFVFQQMAGAGRLLPSERDREVIV